jgi:copper homeostasis protein (lipoprotein)
VPLHPARHRSPAARVRRPATPKGLSLLLVLLGAAAPASAPAETPKPVQKALGPLPATWVGDIPGASGATRWHVDLEADGTFQLRQTHLNRDPERGFDDIGRWRLEPDGQRLVLRGGREAPVFLQSVGMGRQLRKLDLEGRPIRSRLNDRLTRLNQAQPIDPRLHLVGLFRYLADAPSIQLCATGHTLPVAMEADYLRLERAYLQTRAAGAARLVNLEGLITSRPSMESGRPAQRTLVVERLVNLRANQTTCPGGQQLPLRGTDWHLNSLTLQGRQTPPPAGAQPVQLLFDKESDRVSGSGGCNRLMGGFTLDGPSLRFSPLASTKMACSEPVMAFEMNVVRVLEQVRGWRIEGGDLVLVDASGSTLLRYQAPSNPASTDRTTDT